MRLTCICCPRGCAIEIDDSLRVSGNACARGSAYAIGELVSPVRTITGLVKVKGKKRPLSVKTVKPVPKGSIKNVLEELRRVTVSCPVRIGDVVAPNIVATSNIL